MTSDGTRTNLRTYTYTVDLIIQTSVVFGLSVVYINNCMSAGIVLFILFTCICSEFVLCKIQ